mmetsp:Transcript_10396/g.31774  ORF Transcript_10396/g.31774 Transcript_10396/m.31774 type:complete len:202 (-) Transcript_10396:100-705(-)
MEVQVIFPADAGLRECCCFGHEVLLVFCLFSHEVLSTSDLLGGDICNVRKCLDRPSLKARRQFKRRRKRLSRYTEPSVIVAVRHVAIAKVRLEPLCSCCHSKSTVVAPYAQPVLTVDHVRRSVVRPEVDVSGVLAASQVRLEPCAPCSHSERTVFTFYSQSLLAIDTVRLLIVRPEAYLCLPYRHSCRMGSLHLLRILHTL